MHSPIRIVLCGLRPILADALTLLLHAEGAAEVLGAVTDGGELPLSTLALVDVLLFDGRSRTDLAAVIRWWKSRCPRCRMIALDVEQDKVVLDWIVAGLDGLVDAEAQTTELTAALRRAVRGEALVPHSLLTQVVERIRVLSSQTQDKGVASHLTPRETEVLHLVAEGLSNKEIAARLEISLYTAKNHVHNLLEKLKVRYRRQAIRCAFNAGLIKPGAPVVLVNPVSVRQAYREC